MSSVLASYSQIPVRSKYLFAVTTSNHGGFTSDQLAAAVASNPSNILTYDGTILNTVSAASFLGSIGEESYNAIVTGELYRDLGKKLYVQQNGMSCAIFTYSQAVYDAGLENEGVGNAPNLWICTWQAAGTACPNQYMMVKVVRAG